MTLSSCPRLGEKKMWPEPFLMVLHSIKSDIKCQPSGKLGKEFPLYPKPSLICKEYVFQLFWKEGRAVYLTELFWCWGKWSLLPVGEM